MDGNLAGLIEGEERPLPDIKRLVDELLGRAIRMTSCANGPRRARGTIDGSGSCKTAVARQGRAPLCVKNTHNNFDIVFAKSVETEGLSR